ncbi:MAG: DNRLRE domain-containing protein [Clostridium sp.]
MKELICYPSEITSIVSQCPNHNFSKSENLELEYLDDNNQLKIKNGLLKFNLHGCNIDISKFSSAKLYLYVDDVHSNDLHPCIKIKVFINNDDFTTCNSTWNNAPYCTGTRYHAEVCCNQIDKYLCIDISPLVIAWIAGSENNYGITLSLLTEGAVNISANDFIRQPYLYIECRN